MACLFNIVMNLQHNLQLVLETENIEVCLISGTYFTKESQHKSKHNVNRTTSR